MREPKAPTLDELLRELHALSPSDKIGKTITEWAEVWSIGRPRARELVHLAIRTGRMKTMPAYRDDIGRPGRRVQVWLHRFVAKPKGKR